VNELEVILEVILAVWSLVLFWVCWRLVRLARALFKEQRKLRNWRMLNEIRYRQNNHQRL
jgi:hypothetical protein